MARSPSLKLVLGTYVVGRDAHVHRGLRVPPGRDLIVGPGARIDGSIQGPANVYLAAGSIVTGDIVASLDVVIGARARVEGDVVCGANAYVLDGAFLARRLKAAGVVRLVGGSVLGLVEAAGDVEVGGGSVLHAVNAGGRVRSLGSVTS